MAVNPLSIFSGPSPLPSEYANLTNTYAPIQFSQGQQAVQAGQALETQGKSALDMAQRGELTAPQQASVDQYRKGLENTALQTYSNMGLTPSQTTSYISTQADIDQKTIAMAQEFIKTTIALGGAEFSAGASFMQGGSNLEAAAAKELTDAGQAQLTADKAYSDLIGSVFQSVAKMAGAALGGPAGAAAGTLLGGGGSTTLTGGGTPSGGDVLSVEGA
jgi:hypothetical protein